MPERVRLSRRKGWRKPAGAVVVSRPSRWGNLHRDPSVSRTQRVAAFESDLREGRMPYTLDDVRRELRGKDLACWCTPDGPCHADVLLRIANG